MCVITCTGTHTHVYVRQRVHICSDKLLLMRCLGLSSTLRHGSLIAITLLVLAHPLVRTLATYLLMTGLWYDGPAALDGGPHAEAPYCYPFAWYDGVRWPQCEPCSLI